MDTAKNTTAAPAGASAQPFNLSETVYPGQLMDRAMDKLHTIHLALAPDNKGWHDDSTLFSVWATLEQAIGELQLIRNRMQGVEGDAA